MDLFSLMTQGADPDDLVLDRLEGIVALYESPDDSVQDEALARAISLCGKQWGGYRGGIERLVARLEARGGEDFACGVEALRLREEADDPGAMIRAARARRTEAGRLDDEKRLVIAHYGSLEAALDLTPIERLFVEAAEHLSDPDEDGAIDPWCPLAGWSVTWHPVPAVLADAVSVACPLPTTIGDARAEALTWEARRRELEILADGPGAPALPTACAARHLLVERLWRQDLAARDKAELEARAEYWATRAGDDGAGYAVLLEDIRKLPASAPAAGGAGGTRARVLRLKADNPKWSLARIGQELGISRQAVHKHLKKGG